MANTVAICPGSFDPITNGHFDVFYRASKIFDKVVVLVMDNPEKNYCFSVEDRIKMVNNTICALNNVNVDYCSYLLADYAKMIKNCCIVKGLRAISDYEYEFQHALTNKMLNKNLETIYINSSSEYMYLSSSVVRQVAFFNGDISMFVHKDNIDVIKNKFNGGVGL